jgi:hypothetical protein
MKKKKRKNHNENYLCEVKRCKREYSMFYSATPTGEHRRICQKHWKLHTKGIINLKEEKTYR